MSYSEGFAEHRKLVQQSFSQQVVPSYRPVILSENKVLLRSIYHDPDRISDHFKKYVFSAAMKYSATDCE